MTLTYKYQLKGKRAKRLLRRYAFTVNQVWNYCAAVQRKIQRSFKDGLSVPWPSQFDLQKLTSGTSRDLAIHAQTIQAVCERFVCSRDQHKKCPAFRRSKAGPKRSLGWVPFQSQSRQIGTSFVKYLGHEFHFFGSKRRPLPDRVKGGCFVEDSRGRWYVCLQVEIEAEPRASEGSVGIDLGLHDLAVLSNGEKIEAPQVFRHYEEKLGIAQRAKDYDRVRALNAKIRNARQDFLHKQSASLARRFETIFVGDINASALARTRLSKSVLDAGWSMFRNFLRYKVSRHGGVVRDVDEKFTTQTCSTCGGLPPSRPRGIAGLGIREWECSFCGAIHDRDVNAAKNILMIGLSAQPLTEESRVAHGR